MWNLHKNDVIQLADSETKNKYLKLEQNKLRLDLKNTKNRTQQSNTTNQQKTSNRIQ